MNRIIIAGISIAITSLLIGCVSAKYTSKNGEVFSYQRLGIQKIHGFELKRDSDGLVKISFDTQEGSAGDIAETLKNISEILAKSALK